MNALIAMLCAALLLAAAPARAAEKESVCGPLRGIYNPRDYRRAAAEFPDLLYLVEIGHFTSNVERGIRGSTGPLGSDLNYTLTTIPNHARALQTLIMVAARDKSVQIFGMVYPVECYFERAVRFVPDDGIAQSAYANYLQSVGRFDEARARFIEAARLMPDSPLANYNVGLAYFKHKDYALANLHAQRAYARNFPLPGLKHMLVEAGKWDPSVAPPPPAEQDEPPADAASADKQPAPPATATGKE